jgi:hypothetical protein
MADLTTSTLPPADKAPTPFTHTRISALFSRLIVALTTFIEAERDIEDVDVWDPAFDGWLGAAETAQTEVTTLITEIRTTAPVRAADRPLARMTLSLDGMLGAEYRGDYLHFRGLLDKYAPLFRAQGSDVVAYRVNALLQSARQRVEDLATLDCLADDAPNVVPDLEAEIDADALTLTA